MFLAVAIPVLAQPQLPEQPTPIVRAVFNKIESLPPGSRIFMSLDYDPASKPELGPMADAFTRHCALRGHKIFLITLWPTGVPMIEDATRILETEFADNYVYGQNYINLDYVPGQEAAMKLLATDIAKAKPVDKTGRPYALWDIAWGANSLQDMDLLISVGAGYPGTKEWVQYVATPHPDIKLVAGVTGVSAPPLYPYYPQQMIGMLPAIKGAAEYEAALAAHYGTAGKALPELLNDRIKQLATPDHDPKDITAELAEAAGVPSSQIQLTLEGRINCLPRAEIDAIASVLQIDPAEIIDAATTDGCDYTAANDYPTNHINLRHTAYQPALARMAPQLSAHILMLVLIVLGNVIFFIERRRGAQR